MFFKVSLEHDVMLPPRYLGPSLETSIERKLFEDVEAKCFGKYGYVVSVISISDIGEGHILVARGEVLFRIKFDALVFRPIKGEVLDGIVANAVGVGIFVSVGPLRCLLPARGIPDMKYDPVSTPPSYVNEDNTSERIKQGDPIRFRVVAVTIKRESIVMNGDLLGDYLGIQS